MSIGTFPDTSPLPLPPGGRLLTAEEFLEQYDGQRVELVKGIVRELPMPNQEHGYLCSLLAFFLTGFVRSNHLGRVFTNDTSVIVRRRPDTVYGPDVCYVSYERLPKGKLERIPLGVTPEIVVEVRSPSDTWTEVFGKVTDYLRAGVLVVLVMDGESETLSVYRPNAVQATLTRADTLTLPEVLPGFSVPVQDLFE